ncbi:hypothetical protein GB2207_07262 [marine gamma proteobacterium HTCC2207]|jgi:hypothetical protein|uniref:DUF3014 domain-containing protein n=1 Tax=gamma proteobacterium HTCC2207 TaxID=314287 RepID=Q1YP69_9GAMM|nr:hypothetical protein GB2207_07262 [marine gamma proteobacterium HTCC2207] [gamma proteobacterium HTCC2207]
MNREPKKPGSNNLVFIAGTLIAAIIIVAVLFKAQNQPEYDPELIAIPDEPVAEVVIQAPVVPEAVIPEAVEPEPEPPTSSVSTPPPLPKLDNSDDFIRERLLLISNKPEFAKWVKTDDLLRRTASYADGLSNGVLLSKIFPLSAPEGKFATHSSDGTIWLNAGNYERYDRTINTLISLPMDSMAKMFHFTRPLLENAFSEMGYNPRQMDGIILQAIDVILATPIVAEPIRLTRDSVVYKFADPALESLLPLQKQLLRTGPENTKRIQQQAKALREALLNP